MGLLREVLERSAESARQLRTRLATVASGTAKSSGVDTPVATPSNVTPAECDDETLQTPQQQLRQVSKATPPQPYELKPKGVGSTAARLTQLVGENPPAGSLARVTKRKYQSVARERERIDMVADNTSSGSSSSTRTTGVSSSSNENSSYETHSELLDAVEQYEVEFPKLPDASLGIELETDFYGKHTVIKHVRRGSVAFALAKTASGVLRAGHVVVALNGRDLSQLSFEQVLSALKQAAGTARVIRFVDPSVLPMKLFKFEPSLVNRDQYGFAKDDAYILSYRKQLRKRKSMSYPHEKKWTNFVQRVGGLDALDDWINADGARDDAVGDANDSVLRELRALVLSGVPVVLRPRVWSILAGVKKYRRKFGAQYFQHLVSERESSPSVADIEKDVYRTYPEHPFFQTEKGKRELKNVLCAYSLHNESVGYCQSMNFIAGMLVLFMDEEDAFWLLCVLLHKKYLCAENYAQSMLGTQTDQLVFKWLVDREVPAVAARLEHCGIQIQLVTLHWFLCAFVCTLPTETALRVWDWFFLDGERVLFAVAIGVLKLAEGKILSAVTHSDLHTIVRGLGTDLHDEDALVRFLVATLSTDTSGAATTATADDHDANRRKLVDSRAATATSEQATHTLSMPSKSPPAPSMGRLEQPAVGLTKDASSSSSGTRSQPSKLFQQLFQSSPSLSLSSRTASGPLDSDQLAHEQRHQVYRLAITMDEIEQKRKEFRREIESRTQQ